METFWKLETFTAAELARVSGLVMVMQRDWRRRGFIPGFDGKHAQFSLHETAEIIVMKLLADHGIGPSLTRDVSVEAGRNIVWFAIDRQGGPKIIGSPADIKIYKDSYESSLEEIERLSEMSTAELGKFFVKLSYDRYVVTSEPAKEIDEAGCLVSTVLDLEGIAVKLCEQVGRPLAQVFVGARAREEKKNAKV